MSIIFVFIFY